MAYQNVDTPRFYIDQIQYLKSVGFDFEKYYADNYVYGTSLGNISWHSMLQFPEIFTMSPEKQNIVNNFGNDNKINLIIPTGYINKSEINKDNMGRYTAFINHNVSDTNLTLYQNWMKGDGTTYYATMESILNYDSADNRPTKNGITIFEIDKDTDYFNPLDQEYKNFIQIRIADSTASDSMGFNLGSLSWGVYYDMPHSPELDLTMTIENDGFDSITTSGGAHLTNIRYNGAPMWERVDGTQVPPWTIGEPTAVGRRRGRRSWSMNFNQLSDKDLFASNYMSNTYINNPQNSSNDAYNDNDDLVTDRSEFYYTLDNDDSFVAQVLNKIGNGQRFIFQPDNTNNNPDQFAICQLDQDSLNIKQVANGVYNISLKITEVW